MERTLLILRHGKSQRGPGFATDFVRPLAPRGIKAARRMGRLLVELGLEPALIITSTAERARTTAGLVHGELSSSELREEAGLYSADIRQLYTVACGLDDNAACAMLVGHNFVFEEFVDDVAGRDDTVLKTCSLAVLRCDLDSWMELDAGTAQLVKIYHPRELDG